jgi:multicomponent Na+:H+ antiporter subunit C
MNLPAPILYALAGVGLFAIGLHAVIAYAHLFRKILGLNVMGSGVFLVLIAAAYRAPDGPPDPVPHAMVLTGIVVSVCATGLALTLALRVHAVTHRTDLPDDER